MNPEQKLKETSRSLKIIAILSACLAFMLIGSALFIKYKAWSGKERNANIQAGEIAASNAIMKETNVDKLRASAISYQGSYAKSCDQASTNVMEATNIALALSLLPILILLRISNDLRKLGKE